MIHRLPFDKRLEVDEFLNGINDILNNRFNIYLAISKDYVNGDLIENKNKIVCLYNEKSIFDINFQHIYIEVDDTRFALFNRWVMYELFISIVNHWNFYTYNMSEFYRNKKSYDNFSDYLIDNYKWSVKKITTFVWTTYYLNSWLDEKILGVKLEPINFISKWKYFVKMLFYRFK